MNSNSIIFALILSTTIPFISMPKGMAKPNKITPSQRVNVAAEASATIKLSTVKNRTDLLQFSGKRVKLIGYYVSQSWNPGMASNTFEFKGTYHASQIILKDGAVISIFPAGQKQSLRSADEVNKYQGKIVEAIGVVNLDTKSSEFFIDLKKLKLMK